MSGACHQKCVLLMITDLVNIIILHTKLTDVLDTTTFRSSDEPESRHGRIQSRWLESLLIGRHIFNIVIPYDSFAFGTPTALWSSQCPTIDLHSCILGSRKVYQQLKSVVLGSRQLRLSTLAELIEWTAQHVVWRGSALPAWSVLDLWKDDIKWWAAYGLDFSSPRRLDR